MNCDFKLTGKTNKLGWHQVICKLCGFSMFTPHSPELCKVKCGNGGVPSVATYGLSQGQVAELFPGESDPILIGNLIAALTSALGIPPCGACKKRQAWLNKAHAWLRGDKESRPASMPA